MARLDHRPFSWRDDPGVPGIPDDRTVLVVDGDCALCSWGARTIARADPGDSFRITPMQSDAGRALMAHVGLDPRDPCSWLALVDGCALTGSDAVIEVGRRLRGGWPVLARVAGRLPRPVREWAYRLVARNRRRWFGRGDLCGVDEPELQARLF